METPYFIEVDSNGCGKCGHARTWMVVGPDGYDGSVSFEEEDEAQRLADDLSAAYYQGSRQSEKRISELEAQLAEAKLGIDRWKSQAFQCAGQLAEHQKMYDAHMEQQNQAIRERDAQLKAAREALEGYADRDNWAHRRESGCWDWGMGDGDGWEEANKALAALDGEARNA